MNFDKTKAMRNAEKYLSQGKIRAAIGEFKQVLKHDPKDFGTMNMLGDLYMKNSENRAAVGCYTFVAEHYSKQGFAHKAIAIYNKISKLEPNSIEVCSRLAELYREKGSVKEARAHYMTLAEHFQNSGKKLDALDIWKKIASLDSTNTEVYLNLADSYLKEKQVEEAAEAFTEAGQRFAKQGDHENAACAFDKALSAKPDFQRALSGFVDALFALDHPTDAIERLCQLREKQPFNREIQFLLIDCYVAVKDLASAEQTIIKLVEQEPANYPKLLELGHVYLLEGDVVSATRIVSMSSEHLLVGGQAEELSSIVSQILDKAPEHLEALRLLARYCSWQRDEAAFRDSLIRLAEAAKKNDSVDDERYALSQMVMIAPHEMAYAERLKEINEIHGFADSVDDECLFDKRFLKGNNTTPKADAKAKNEDQAIDFTMIGTQVAAQTSNGNGYHADPSEEFSAEILPDPDPYDEGRLQKEADSIRFYIENGYTEIAEKAINELEGDFGPVPQVSHLRSLLKRKANGVQSDELSFDQGNAVNLNGNGKSGGGFDFADLRSELGLEETTSDSNSDFETNYNTAIAYKEMGLVEEAIREFQHTVSTIEPNDGTRRFFQCANMLGHCFMEIGKPNLAIKWYLRTLETLDISDEERHGLWYELASAYEAEGDIENAGRFFEQVYVENINYRDVSEKMRSLTVAR
ncbi:MAG: tetratricopeptide repeat protein [Blastocatellia bacterium]